jgi:hypothetical protein
MSDAYKGIERAVIIAAAKEMNKVLDLDPAISLKDDAGAKLTTEAIAEQIVKWGKGFDEKTNKFDPELAVTRDDKLSKETFAVLETLEVLPKKKAKSLSEEASGAKKGAERSGGSRGQTKRFHDFESMKSGLSKIKPDDVTQARALRMDALLLKGYSVKKLQEVADENKLGPIMAHAAFRVTQGYIIDDTRENTADKKGTLTLSGFDPKKKGAVSKVPKAETEKKAKVKKDLAADADDEKVERKSKKGEKAAPAAEPTKAKKGEKVAAVAEKPVKAKKAKKVEVVEEDDEDAGE